MTHYKPGDVLVTSFPFADNSHSKRRPVLCLAPLSPKKGILLYWVVMITSTELKGWSGDVEITNHKKVGLPAPSIIRTAKIACIDHNIVTKKVGSIDPKTLDTVTAIVVKALKTT
jgi:mRNA interferase MazF